MEREIFNELSQSRVKQALVKLVKFLDLDKLEEEDSRNPALSRPW